MAIIDSKLSVEESRQAREYAQRNDTAATSHDWQQPPPAYEEASSTSQSTTPLIRDAAHSDADQSTTRREEEASAQSEDSDENTPLLTRRRRQFLTKSQRVRHKIKKGLLFISISLILACVALLILDIIGILDDDPILPDAPESDGVPIEDPIWSPGVRIDPDLWPNKNTPLYSSTTGFNFDAFKAHYLRQRENGGISSGQVVIASGEDVADDKEWKKLNKGLFNDCVFVEVEARFSDSSLLKGTRVNKLRMSKDKEGVGIYGAAPDHSSKNWYLSFHVTIFLPTPNQRSERGLPDGKASFISELDVDVDNMRISFEALQGFSTPKDGIIFGNVKTSQMNSGLDIVSGLKATRGISMHCQNGAIRDIALPTNFYTMLSPSVHIEVANGHIWLSKVIAKEDIVLKTTNGGINITDIAIAESIKVKHSTGMIGGTYRANELEIISRQGPIHVDIDLRPKRYDEDIQWYLNEESHLEKKAQALERCRHNTVQVSSEYGPIEVNYRNQDINTRLNSRIESDKGSVEIHHASSFEGAFQASAKLGNIDVFGPHGEVIQTGLSKVDSLQGMKLTPPVIDAEVSDAGYETKYFVVTADKRYPLANKRIEGRTWFADHQWDDKKDFCQSKSIVKVALGKIGMYFE